MLRWNKGLRAITEAGDTLIEVTIALSILSFVLVSSTAVATASLRMGETAANRIQIANVAQEQMEALRSFRDNNSNASGLSTWTNAFVPGIDSQNGPSGFHMALQVGSSTTWVPVSGPMTTSSPGGELMIPTSQIEITSATPAFEQACGYIFTLKYSFQPLGGSYLLPDANQIQTTLVNLHYAAPSPGGAQCPQ
jgi:type II secretory pathway pseudopilin PulG